MLIESGRRIKNNMVKIYFDKEEDNDKEKFVDINIWSLVKANILSSLLINAIIIGAILGLIIIGSIIGGML